MSSPRRRGRRRPGPRRTESPRGFGIASNRRLWLLLAAGGVTVGVAVGVIVAAVLTSGGSDTAVESPVVASGESPTAQERPDARAGRSLGAADAPVTVVEFSDFQ